ncbi:hypothetical protein HJFPF1_06032 [Paramyrothecium foliicola]|nr:hypothetical protein HJFPF1_06032 [Paramyrothecium foliicola]
MAGGFLVPDHFVYRAPSRTDMNLASIVWGLTLAVAVFSASKGVRQSYKSAKRGHRWSAYIIYIWMEWVASVTISVMSWCYLRGYIRPSFQYYFITLCLWCVQIQAIMQIIINRIQFLMVVRKNATRLKWGVFIILALINISVFIIWIPARLQISPRWIHINNVWDRIEKGIFLVIDLSLNIYFIYLVRSGLIANGLTKYIPLFRFNMAMIGLSMTMDILIIAMMSLPTDTIYVQFHPLAYLVKLHIEMNMADLIAKVVKASNPFGQPDHYGNRSGPRSKSPGPIRSFTGKLRPRSALSGENAATIESGGNDHVEMSPPRPEEAGIRKTITTHIFSSKKHSWSFDPYHNRASESSSTGKLKRDRSQNSNDDTP